MISKMEISGIHSEVEPKLHKYVVKKIGHMDKYFPRAARESAHVQVKLKERKIKQKNEFTCEVIVSLPREQIAVTETTMNMFASVDIVETKLKNRLKKYKEKNAKRRIPARLLQKLRSRQIG